jgi:hypothetical protein
VGTFCAMPNETESLVQLKSFRADTDRSGERLTNPVGNSPHPLTPRYAGVHQLRIRGAALRGRTKLPCRANCGFVKISDMSRVVPGQLIVSVLCCICVTEQMYVISVGSYCTRMAGFGTRARALGRGT